MKKNASSLNILNGDIEFKKINFNYESENRVLKDVNLYIEGDEMTSLVGRSGAGKSSIINLIQDLSKDGDITIDGQSIYDLGLTSLEKYLTSDTRYSFIR